VLKLDEVDVYRGETGDINNGEHIVGIEEAGLQLQEVLLTLNGLTSLHFFNVGFVDDILPQDNLSTLSNLR
jgi:hypothetical protein